MCAMTVLHETNCAGITDDIQTLVGVRTEALASIVTSNAKKTLNSAKTVNGNFESTKEGKIHYFETRTIFISLKTHKSAFMYVTGQQLPATYTSTTARPCL